MHYYSFRVIVTALGDGYRIVVACMGSVEDAANKLWEVYPNYKIVDYIEVSVSIMEQAMYLVNPVQIVEDIKFSQYEISQMN